MKKRMDVSRDSTMTRRRQRSTTARRMVPPWIWAVVVVAVWAIVPNNACWGVEAFSPSGSTTTTVLVPRRRNLGILSSSLAQQQQEKEEPDKESGALKKELDAAQALLSVDEYSLLGKLIQNRDADIANVIDSRSIDNEGNSSCSSASDSDVNVHSKANDDQPLSYPDFLEYVLNALVEDKKWMNLDSVNVDWRHIFVAKEYGSPDELLAAATDSAVEGKDLQVNFESRDIVLFYLYHSSSYPSPLTEHSLRSKSLPRLPLPKPQKLLYLDFLF